MQFWVPQKFTYSGKLQNRGAITTGIRDICTDFNVSKMASAVF